MDKAYKAVQQLVKDFSNNETAYLAPNYQESRVRQDFVDKLFAALGWDVTHERQKNPYEQEVKIENRVQTGGSQRRADYAFFITPNFRDVKFFVEAKKPAHDLKKHDYYHQAIRYGWNQGTPLAVLTDFEEFHILDCRYKPNIETALEHSVRVYRYKDYADKEKFAEIFYLFGRDAVADGSLEKFAATLPRPRGKAIQKGLFKGGYQPVDEAFLEELDGYRETLAKAFKKENQELEGEELTEAVQRTIDRLVFIRFLEDKQIEDPAIINYREKKSAWGAFLAHCRSLEPKYNGLVFKPHRILDGKEFNPPDDNHFADICNKLADPSSPYDFNHIPISILGSIYERFLGKVVKATDHQAKIQDKPEVRKAGGVYYTPEYIVRYIVNETVGKLIEGKTPEQIAQMAFADIACGSGSFLIEVYSRLLEYHARYYAERPKAARKEDIAKREGKTVLSLKKRQEILLNNIYGVDIDFQATEVTQLSLYLKLLEDATTNDAYQFGLLKEKILPDLRNNIICGNSLIGTDILEGDLFGREEDKKLNPMNFADAFPKIMKRGGFDAVVGNPPYGFHQIHSKQVKPYFKANYISSQGSYEHYFLFYERSLGLLKKTGRHGFIVPVTWLTIPSAKSLRKFILENFAIKQICWLPELVFENAQVNTLISLIDKAPKGQTEIRIYDSLGFTNSPASSNNFEQTQFVKADYYIGIFESRRDTDVVKKIASSSQPLNIVGRPCSGYNPYEVGKGKAPNGKPQTKETVETKPYHSEKKLGKEWKPEIVGRDLSRYYINITGKRWIKYGSWLAAPRDPNNFSGKRILVQEITGGKERRIVAAYYDGELYHSRDVIPIKMEKEFPNPIYVLALVNSKLITWYHHKRNPKAQKGLFPKILVADIANLPIRAINFSDPKDKARHDRIVKLVEQMLAAKEQRAGAKTEKDENKLDLHIAALDRQIDEAVYELYGLTEEEIKVVEGE